MYQPRKRNHRLLWALIAVGVLYDALIFVRHRLIENPALDGAFGVLLGLYICSRGATNLLDMIMYGRLLQLPWTSRRAEAGWVALNVLILMVGWGVIAIGATQFVRAPVNGRLF